MSMRSLVLFAAASISLSACNGNAPTAPSEITSAQVLVQQLQSRGATATIAEEMPRQSNPFFSVNARRVVVNAANATVFEYPDASSLNADAAKVDPSGTPIGGTQITWIAPPRFYRSTRLLVIYAGTSGDVAAHFEEVLGRPFAGVR
jgi:hypothetical protein